MKKLKSMNVRDEKVESLLMEKWGYSAPTLNEGAKEDGDKGLLQELAPAIPVFLGLSKAAWTGVVAITALIGAVAYGEYDENTKQSSAADFDEDHGIKSQSLMPGATQLESPEGMAQRLENFDFPQAKTGEPFTWEDALIGAGATEEQRRSLEKTLRTKLGEEGLKIFTTRLDKHFKQREGYQSLTARGRQPADPDILATAKQYEALGMIETQPELQDALATDTAEQERVGALMNDEEVQTVDQEKLDNIMAGIGSDEYHATNDQVDLENISLEIDGPTGGISGASGILPIPIAPADQAAAEQAAAEKLAAEQAAAEERDRMHSRDDLDDADITYESRTTKSTKDIIREEINKYFSNRRRS